MERDDAAWALALNGIQQLSTQLRQVLEGQAAQSREIEAIHREMASIKNQIFEGDSTVLSMADARIAAARTELRGEVAALRVEVTARQSGHDTRIASLEEGALATVVDYFQADQKSRRERQIAVDTRDRRRFWAVFALVGVLFVALIAAVVISTALLLG